MSFFSIFRSPGNMFSQKMKYISSAEIKFFFNKYKWSSVNNSEEDLVESAILSGRNNSGRISLRKVYNILKKLENKRKISQIDRKVILNEWKTYFK